MLGFKQLWFDFTRAYRRGSETTSPPPAPVSIAETPATKSAPPVPILAGKPGQTRDLELEGQCRELLLTLGMNNVSDKVRVYWNARLRSSAGYASYPAWRIELNPRLKEFEGQVERTLKHELAHLVAYHRRGHARISPHGTEWRRACADLGIPDEDAHHRLPLPRRKVVRKYTYVCPSCRIVVHRVRRFRRHTACLACCKRHGDGGYNAQFQFQMVKARDSAKGESPHAVAAPEAGENGR